MAINTLPLQQVSVLNENLKDRIKIQKQRAYNDVHLSFKERKEANKLLETEEDLQRCKGDKVVELLRQYIRKKRSLSKQQLLFTELYIQALFPFIYAEEFISNELRIMTENFINKLHQVALICCPRRFGKTYITAWFAACAIAAIPSIRVTLFSPSKRQSVQIMTHVRRMFYELVELAGVKYSIQKGKNNQENFAVYIDGTERIVKGLPAKENTTRGVDADLAILDEGAATPKIFVTKVVFPVAIPGKTALVILSTIQGATDSGEDNWFTTMMSLSDEFGQPLSATYKFVLACEKCIELGQEDSCKCNLSELPHWHNKSKHMLLEQIYHGLGEDEAMAQENKGIINKSTKTMFAENAVNYFFNSAKNTPFDHSSLTEPPPYVFTYIDPASSGTKSEMAMVSMFKYQGQYIFCGLDSFKVELTKVYVKDAVAHLKKIRTLPKLENVVIVIAIENNQGIPVKDFANEILDRQTGVKDVVFLGKDFFEESVSNVKLYQGKRNRDGAVIEKSGLVTRGEIKLEAARLFRDKLQQSCFKFSKHSFVSHFPNDKITHDELLLQNKNKFKAQLKGIALVSKPIRNDENAAFDEYVFTISGKAGGKADDLAVAAQLGVRLIDKFEDSTRYKQAILSGWNNLICKI